MPIEYSIDPERNFVRETATGKVTAADLREFALRQMSDPLFRRGQRAVSDLTQAHLQVYFEELLAFVHWMASQKILRIRQAIVVARPLEFGIGRMFEQLSENEANRSGWMRVFWDAQAAEAWVLAEGDAGAA